MSKVIGFPGYNLMLPDIVKAENAHLFDVNGKRYVDLESGVWCMSVGHANAEVLETMAAQSAQLGHVGYCYSTPVVEAAAERMLELANCENGRCVFLCSGSEAIEYGMRVAQMVAPRSKFLMMSDSYFGAYGSANQKAEDVWTLFDWFGCEDCTVSGECDSRCERWNSIPFDEIGGFLLEPGSSSGWVRFPPVKLITSIEKQIRAQHGLFVVNEVTTGIGRTGEWFGYMHYGVQPDIVAMGKGIGNGYPVSVTTISPAVLERMEGRPVLYSQSHQNDATGAAVALKVVEIIAEQNLLGRCRELSARLMAELEALNDRFACIAQVRGRGLMVAVEFAPEYADRLATLHAELVHKGFILTHRPGTALMRLDPPLTIEWEDVAAFVNTFAELIERMDA